MKTSAPTSLRNFLKMSPDAPQYSDRNQHYLISGSNPTYYLDNPGTQEEQVAPLIASNKWQQHALVSGAQISDVTEDTESTYDGYTIDKNSSVFGFNIIGNSYTGFSTPTGSGVSGSTNKVKCFAGYLHAVVTTTASNIYRMQLPGSIVSPVWSGAILLSGTNEETFIEPFLEYLMVTYSTTQVRKLDSSFSLNIGINFGAGWSIKGMRNYNDTYLAIAAAQGNFNNNYLFLWNGRDDRPNYSIKMAGKYLDMKVVDGTLYVSVWISGAGNFSGLGKTVLFRLKGTTLVEVLTPQISTMSQIAGDKGVLFDFSNRVGMNLTTTDLLIYNKSEVGEEEFVVSTGIVFNKFSGTYNGFIVGVVGTGMYYYNYRSTTFNPIRYLSQWMPVQNLSAIDVIYDSPPQSADDAIHVTILGKGEDIIDAEISTTPLQDITPSQHLNLRRTRLDVKGFTGSMLMIQLTTTNNSTWRPIIREINPI